MSSHIYRRFIQRLDLKLLREAILRAGATEPSGETKSAPLNEKEGPMSDFLATRRDPIKMLDLLGFRKTDRGVHPVRSDLTSGTKAGGRPANAPVPVPSIIAERIARLARRGR